jgi:quercetin dioxygenase-like cupin family protein
MRLYELPPGAAITTRPSLEHQVFVLAGQGRLSGEEDECLLGEGDVAYVASWSATSSST